MWFDFAIAVAFGLVIIFVPGFLAVRAFARSSASAVALAPIVSITAYAVMGIAFEKLGLTCSWIAFFAPLCVLSAILFAVRFGMRRLGVARGAVECSKAASSVGKDILEPVKPFSILLIYCLTGLIAASVFFLGNLETADSFVQEYDNVSHLSRIQTFVQSGSWSCFGSAYYPDTPTGAMDPLPSSGFYPSAWHVLAAMIVDALGVSVPFSANVVSFIFIAFVFSSGFSLLFRAMFPMRPAIQLCGVLCVYAFAAFPWELLIFGPIYPNLASLCLSPAVAACFMFVVGETTRFRRVIAVSGLLLGALVLLLLQPNTIFTLSVFLAPYCVWRLYRCVFARIEADSLSKARLAGLGAAFLFVFAAVFLWLFAYNLPALNNLVSFEWPAFVGKLQAAINVALLAFKDTNPQPVLSILVAIGILYSIKHREHLWITFSFAIMCVMYIVDASTNSELKHILTGFWYTDPWRIGANAALFAIPLAALGVYGLSKILYMAFARRMLGEKRVGSAQALSVVLVVLVAVVGVYYPWSAETAFGGISNSIQSAYSASRENVLNPEERSFLQAVSEIVPEDAVIINEPNDGSAFAYAMYDLNIYYRSMDHYDDDSERAESETIRTGLDRISVDPAVEDAVERVGADYLLQLDQADWNLENRYLFSYQSEYYIDMWKGIDAVNDATPGFELVLSEGDMRLYRIL